MTAIIVGFFVSGQIESDSLERTRRELANKAELLRAVVKRETGSLDGSLPAGFREELGAFALDGTRITLISPGGAVVADTREDPARMDDHSGREEIGEARESGEGFSTRFSATLNTTMLYYALPLESEGKNGGFVRVALPKFDVSERRAHLRFLVVVGALIAAAAALLPGLLLARQVTKPLAVMKGAAERIAAGEYGRKLWRGGSDEAASLARSFDAMGEQLQERIGEITADRNKLHAILSGLAEGVVAVDRSERVIHMNAEAARILGACVGESLGKPIWEVTRTRVVCEALSATLRGGGHGGEFAIPAEKMDTVLELRTSPLRGAGGELVGAVAVLADVTELRRLAMVRRDFVANVSHEMKTPLTALRSMAETLLDDPKMGSRRRREFLERIIRQSDQVSELVSDLLELSRIETRSESAPDGGVELRAAVGESVAAYRRTAEAKGLTLVEENEGEPVGLRAHRRDIDLLLGNLLDNAVKYTPPGGRIVARLFAEGRSAVLEVQDTGVGIEPREQQRIFERFYRVDKARSRELGGTGLGLSIVRNIVEALGGGVAVESMPGQGSTFRVVLPLR